MGLISAYVLIVLTFYYDSCILTVIQLIALFAAMAITSDNTLLYTVDTTFSLVCIDVETGAIVWSSDGDRKSGYVAAPRISEVDGQTSMVYVIETEDGNVRQHDGDDGDINWLNSCFDRSGIIKCRDSVEAEFR
jgi:outer membrane protein assembly factor BamB